MIAFDLERDHIAQVGLDTESLWNSHLGVPGDLGEFH